MYWDDENKTKAEAAGNKNCMSALVLFKEKRLGIQSERPANVFSHFLLHVLTPAYLLFQPSLSFVVQRGDVDHFFH